MVNPGATVPAQEAPAKSVPAAAVIRMGLTLFGIIGRKGRVGGLVSLLVKSSPLNGKIAGDTTSLESGRGEWNSRCSGGMRRYLEEHSWRRRLAGPFLTLRHESQGSERD